MRHFWTEDKEIQTCATRRNEPMKTLEIRRPDDLHLHFRDGDALGYTVPATANVFRRAIVMPNLVPPVTTVALASEYRDRILKVVPKGKEFEPLMVLYLRDDTSPEELIAAAKVNLYTALSSTLPARRPTRRAVSPISPPFTPKWRSWKPMAYLS